MFSCIVLKINSSFKNNEKRIYKVNVLALILGGETGSSSPLTYVLRSAAEARSLPAHTEGIHEAAA